jgi:hypothetical protein
MASLTHAYGRGELVRQRRLMVGAHYVEVSEVFRSYWFFASERQRVYHRRLSGAAGPWTTDPVIRTYRFTNAYRAADRVSQDLIRVLYEGPQEPEDVVFRALLFRLFNKPSTWDSLEAEFGELTWASFDVDAYARVLDGLLERGSRVYSAAYIIPPPPFGAARKHMNHLLLISHMMKHGLVHQLQEADSLRAVFETICAYPSLGPFLAYQLAIDLNYSTVLDFDENDFVVPGPGARSGIAKCFPGADPAMAADLIRWMVENQEEQFDLFEFDFQDLFGRRLSLIDCQNLFCETDKYARVAHPSVPGVGNRQRIKQQFAAHSVPAQPVFPPKWGLTTAPSALRDLELVAQ